MVLNRTILNQNLKFRTRDQPAAGLNCKHLKIESSQRTVPGISQRGLVTNLSSLWDLGHHLHPFKSRRLCKHINLPTKKLRCLGSKMRFTSRRSLYFILIFLLCSESFLRQLKVTAWVVCNVRRWILSQLCQVLVENGTKLLCKCISLEISSKEAELHHSSHCSERGNAKMEWDSCNR